MNDKELLEMAAKAAGIDYIKPADGYDGALGLVLSDSHGGHEGTWNPLTDDGDALRLAVKLKLLVDVDGSHCTTACDGTKENDKCEIHNGDPYTATRRAIVRAAASIGKEMP